MVLCATDSISPLNDGKQLSGNFDSGLPKEATGPKVARQFVTSRRTPSAYNPCNHKKCYPGYSCKAISNQYLLQVPVAVCVQDSVIKIGTYNCIATAIILLSFLYHATTRMYIYMTLCSLL